MIDNIENIKYIFNAVRIGVTYKVGPRNPILQVDLSTGHIFISEDFYRDNTSVSLGKVADSVLYDLVASCSYPENWIELYNQIVYEAKRIQKASKLIERI